MRRRVVRWAAPALFAAAAALADGPAFVTLWGGFGSAPGQFAFPHHLAVTPAGEVYVGEVVNDRVQRFSAAVATPARPDSWGAVKRRYR